MIYSCPKCGSEAGVTHGDQTWISCLCEGCELDQEREQTESTAWGWVKPFCLILGLLAALWCGLEAGYRIRGCCDRPVDDAYACVLSH